MSWKDLWDATKDLKVGEVSEAHIKLLEAQLTLQEKDYEAVVSDRDRLQEENSQLKIQVEKLSARVEELEATASRTSADLHDDELAILRFLIGKESVLANSIAVGTGLSIDRTDFRLSSMPERSLVYVHINVFEGNSYSLGDSGRQILIDMGEI